MNGEVTRNASAEIDRALIIVLTTVSTNQQAETLAKQLIESSMAACVQVEGPIISHYAWEGKNQREQEWRLVIKTVQGAWPALQTRLVETHPYDEPQIIAVPVTSSSDGYATWVREQTLRSVNG